MGKWLRSILRVDETSKFKNGERTRIETRSLRKMTIVDVQRQEIFSRPQNGVLSLLPPSWVPYAELIRLHKPVGIMNIFYPYLFGAMFAVCTSNPTVPADTLLSRILWLFADAFVLRSAGCSWNDVVDADLDRMVARTCLRPVARGAISPRAGSFFAILLGFIWLGILSHLLPRNLAQYAIPLIILVFFYPYAKRVTNYPQVVLGVTLSWGVFIGAAVLEVDCMDAEKGADTIGLACLYSVYTTWTVIHDLVYAHQDVQDDIKAGIKSMAIPWLNSTKTLLAALTVVQDACLAAVGMSINAGPSFHFVAVGGNAIILAIMTWKVDLSNPQSCLWWFQTASLLVGASVVSGFCIDYASRL